LLKEILQAVLKESNLKVTGKPTDSVLNGIFWAYH